jgi:hypothetical protein
MIFSCVGESSIGISDIQSARVVEFVTHSMNDGSRKGLTDLRPIASASSDVIMMFT